MNEDGLDLQEEEAEEPDPKRRVKRAALALLLTGLAVAAYYANRQPAVGPPPALALAQVTELPEPMAVDTPPLRPASGWPFAQLPHIAKFEAPVPRLSMTMQPRMPVAQALPVPVRQFPPAAETPGDVPLWVLSPLAAGAFLVDADVSGAGSVVPEPATTLLLATGLLALGAKARASRRRRRGDDPTL